MSKIVLIVEGINDKRQVRKALNDIDDVEVLVTEGTKVNSKIIDEIYHFINNGYTPYIMSDPDIAGLHLAEMVKSHFPSVERVEVDVNECGYHTGKKIKAGVEYGSYEYLKSIIFPLIGKRYIKKKSPICWD